MIFFHLFTGYYSTFMSKENKEGEESNNTPKGFEKFVKRKENKDAKASKEDDKDKKAQKDKDEDDDEALTEQEEEEERKEKGKWSMPHHIDV